MAEYTLIPDGDPPSTCSDGYICKDTTFADTAFAELCEATNGTDDVAYVRNTDETPGGSSGYLNSTCYIMNGFGATGDSGVFWYLQEAVFTFDLTGIGEGETVSAAVLRIFCGWIYYQDGEEYANYNYRDTLTLDPPAAIGLYGANPASPTALVPADRLSFGTTLLSDTATGADWTPESFVDFTLTAAGLAYLNAALAAGAATVSFSLRNQNYVVANQTSPGSITPNWSSWDEVYFYGWYADIRTAGTETDYAIYPDANPNEVDSCDGYITVWPYNLNSSWPDIAAHPGDEDSTAATSIGFPFDLTTHITVIVRIQAGDTEGGWISLREAVYIFDLSDAVPEGGTITACSFSLCAGTDDSGKIDRLGIQPNLGLYSIVTAADNDLDATDRASMGTTLLSNTVSYADWPNNEDTAQNWVTFTLNEAGLAYAQAAQDGDRKLRLALRNPNYVVASILDPGATAPHWESQEYAAFGAFWSEVGTRPEGYANRDKAPYLSITHAPDDYGRYPRLFVTTDGEGGGDPDPPTPGQPLLLKWQNRNRRNIINR
jgi:hypothetical protein